MAGSFPTKCVATAINTVSGCLVPYKMLLFPLTQLVAGSFPTKCVAIAINTVSGCLVPYKVLVFPLKQLVAGSFPPPFVLSAYSSELCSDLYVNEVINSLCTANSYDIL